MGAQAASPTGSQVYYDTSAKKYYTLDAPQNSNMPSGMYSMLSPLFNIASDSSQYRNYINNMPYKENATFTSTPYAELTNLFPGLNAGLPSNLGLSQGLMSSTQPDGAMYGAGRFLSPSNTQGK